MSRSRQIEAEAAAWLARREGGMPWSAEDAGALAAWRAESTAHQVAFIRLEAAWKEGARLKALGAGVPRGVIPEPRDLRRSIFFRRRRLGAPATGTARDLVVRPRLPWRPRRVAWGVAASLAAVLFVSAAWLIWPQPSVFRTPVGGLETVPLADGSKVTLNTDTAIRVAMTGQHRRVVLARGEAFFEVAKDAARPFVVEAGGERVVAVGTQFSVRREAQDVRIIVTEGKVRVERDGEGAGADAPVALVSAGESARTQASQVLVASEEPAQREAALSWRRGYLIFEETPIADAVREFNRYSTRKIVIDDPSIGSIRIGGNFRSTSSEAFLRLLADGFPVKVEERDDEVFLTRR